MMGMGAIGKVGEGQLGWERGKVNNSLVVVVVMNEEVGGERAPDTPGCSVKFHHACHGGWGRGGCCNW